MPSIYEINQSILDCLDAETGEIIDAERLDALLMEKDQKIENVVCWIKNLMSDADAIKAEKEALAEREAKCRKKAEDLKNWISKILEGQKFSTAKCFVSFRKSTKLEIVDAEIIPKEFMVEHVTTKPDANAIKERLKNGQEVSGCVLVENNNIQIK